MPSGVLRKVGIGAFITAMVFTFFITLSELAYGQGYSIDQEAANETVDNLTEDGISLFQLLSRMTHRAISGSVDTFYPGEVDPMMIVVLSIVASAVTAFTIAMKVGGHISKVVMIVIIALVALFMALPMFQEDVSATAILSILL